MGTGETVPHILFLSTTCGQWLGLCHGHFITNEGNLKNPVKKRQGDPQIQSG